MYKFLHWILSAKALQQGYKIRYKMGEMESNKRGVSRMQAFQWDVQWLEDLIPKQKRESWNETKNKREAEGFPCSETLNIYNFSFPFTAQTNVIWKILNLPIRGILNLIKSFYHLWRFNVSGIKG